MWWRVGPPDAVFGGEVGEGDLAFGVGVGGWNRALIRAVWVCLPLSLLWCWGGSCLRGCASCPRLDLELGDHGQGLEEQRATVTVGAQDGPDHPEIWAGLGVSQWLFMIATTILTRIQP